MPVYLRSQSQYFNANLKLFCIALIFIEDMLVLSYARIKAITPFNFRSEPKCINAKVFPELVLHFLLHQSLPLLPEQNIKSLDDKKYAYNTKLSRLKSKIPENMSFSTFDLCLF